MVIILEGPNRCGKTTLAKMLQNAGFKYFKSDIVLSPVCSLIRMNSMLDMLKQLDHQRVNCVVDRFHITERVYGKLSRRQEVDIEEIDQKCADAGFILYYMTDCINGMKRRGASKETDSELSYLLMEYDKEFLKSKMMKYFMAIGEQKGELECIK